MRRRPLILCYLFQAQISGFFIPVLQIYGSQRVTFLQALSFKALYFRAEVFNVKLNRLLAIMAARISYRHLTVRLPFFDSEGLLISGPLYANVL